MYDLIFQKVFRVIRLKSLSILISKIIYSLLYIKFIISYILCNNNYKSKSTYSKEFSIIKHFNSKVKNTRNNIIRNKNITCDLTIIIPAYNAEKYISCCLNSIFKQNIKFSYEVIVINDGSIDNTLNIINSFRDNKNLVIISQENAGISATRNKGLEVASGKYIMFLDSDDLLENNSINLLLSEALENNIDIVEGNYLFYYEDNSTVSGKPKWTEKFFIDLISNKYFISKIQGFPWGRIYSRDLWANVNFPLNFDYEDSIIQLTIFQKASTFVYIPNNIYKYRITKSSISSRLKGTEKSLDSYFVLKYIIDQNKLIGLEMDSHFYKLILKHLGYLLYLRTNGINKSLMDSLLEDASLLLIELENYRPKDLSLKEKLLINSIKSQNTKKWLLCAKFT